MSVFVPQKKVEIVIEAVKVPNIIKLIDDLGLPGYSILRNVAGRGSHGMRDAQEVTDVLSNDYIVAICSHEQAQKLVREIAPILKKFGGICYMSDVQEFRLD